MNRMIASQISNAQVRVMNPGDLSAAVELSTAAGWNQILDDWRMLMDLAPSGCFAIEADGQLVSTTTLVCYGQRLAWIGMVLTKHEYRGRGFARRLLAHALDYADTLGIETIKLDATDPGRPLYETFGFEVEQSVERWTRPGSSNLGSGSSAQRCDYSRDLDLRAFGVDRSVVLQRLANRSELHTDFNALLFTRPGRSTAYLGPCVASDAAAARALITTSVKALPHTGWSWDLLPNNRDAFGLASELRFTRQRLLTRMARGKLLRARDDMVYAIAGLELG